MPRSVGGRGKTPVYGSTTHVRVPTPIKEIVLALIDIYRDTALLGVDNLDEYHSLVEQFRQLKNKAEGNVEDENKPSNSSLICLEDAIKVSKQLLTQKKSARETVAKLLTALYGDKVSIDALK